MTTTDAVPPPSTPPASPIPWLRYTAMAEGVSYLLLLGVAMPLKYLADMPMAVKVVGWAHGLLFILLMLLLVVCFPRLKFKWTAITFIAALLPFGPFVIDHKLKRFDQPTR